MAALPAKNRQSADRCVETGRQFQKVTPGFFLHFLQFDHGGNLAIQEVVQIQSIAAGFSIGEILLSVVDARERPSLRSRILPRVELWRTAFGVAKVYWSACALPPFP